MSGKSLDEMEEELGRIPAFIKPFLIIGTVLTALICLPYIAIKILSDKSEDEDD